MRSFGERNRRKRQIYSWLKYLLSAPLSESNFVLSVLPVLEARRLNLTLPGFLRPKNKKKKPECCLQPSERSYLIFRYYPIALSNEQIPPESITISLLVKILRDTTHQNVLYVTYIILDCFKHCSASVLSVGGISP